MTADQRETITRGKSASPVWGRPARSAFWTAHVAIVGCGALGSFHAGRWRRAGMGHSR